MGSHRSKEDEILKISTFVFVTNFPKQFKAKNLWNTYKQYRYVVDAFILIRRAKDGKRFGFVRFIKVLDVDHLVSNLCTVWVGRYKIHANVARFQRAPLHTSSNQYKSNGKKRHNTCNGSNDKGTKGYVNSYAHAVKGFKPVNVELESILALVLDDTCLNQQDYSQCLMGKIKEFASLSNLKVVLASEGFDQVIIRYMGGHWIMLEFLSVKVKKKFESSVGIGSWFSQIQQASVDFTVDRRIAWVELEGGKVRRIGCDKEVPGWVPDFVDESDDETDSDKESIEGELNVGQFKNEYNMEGDSECEEVPETKLADESPILNSDEASVGQNVARSEDPFNIYDLLNKKKENTTGSKEDDSLKHPPGFTPKEIPEDHFHKTFGSKKESGEGIHITHEDEVGSKKDLKEDGMESVCSGHFNKPKIPCSGGSMIHFMDELVKVGETMGLAQKAKKDWVKELCVTHMVNFLALQETKMETIDFFAIKSCWGNFAFDFIHSDSVGNSGGILCVWDSNSFKKLNSTVSDYFVIIRGDWMSNGKKLLIILVYAPQELTEKKMLWDYLSHAIANWQGEVIIMGDFNEVRNKAERFGLVFNVQGANIFNYFISSAGLEEVPLGAVTLDRYLSDHWPILLCESKIDYGPIPFWFFHYWFEVEGFDKLVEDSWNEAPVDVSNAMSNLMKKLKYLKEKIRVWNIEKRRSSRINKHSLKAELAELDMIIDNGEGNANVINKRTKRNQLAIRGVLVEGNWIKAPDLVKSEFLSHFKNWFAQPQVSRLNLNSSFPRNLSSIQQADLEIEVSKEEVKRVVWDCGINKSPSPDGFTFGFYRHFWNLIENDVVEAVKYFFHQGSFPKGCNSSFIALISKNPEANMVKDYRTISLIGSLYKIIAKILANRLVVVLGDLVNEKKQSLIFKVDFEKAYDSVRWDYLDDVLKKLDPRMPLIFKGLGMFKGIVLGPMMQVSHMFYADDAVLLGQWSDSNIDTIVCVLECFHRASGLRINVSKSKLMGISVNEEKIAQATLKIGCSILKAPFSYLGSKVGGLMSRIQSWNEIVESMVARLLKWKMKTLSIGGSGTDLCGKKSIWVKWNHVLVLKEKGGLGVSSLYALNRALMFKWIWRFITHSSSLWARVIKAIHGEDRKIGKNSKAAYPYLWLDIVNETELFKKKDIDIYEPRGGMEHSQLVDLLATVEGVVLVDMRDRPWIKAMPIKVNVHAWKVRLDCLPTRLNISQRGMDIGSILCPICDTARLCRGDEGGGEGDGGGGAAVGAAMEVVVAAV
ncbi:RNA-directed DNA polymerase, eukaryota [Tanacetum coccineum]